jgi:hypothetical protein
MERKESIAGNSLYGGGGVKQIKAEIIFDRGFIHHRWTFDLNVSNKEHGILKRCGLVKALDILSNTENAYILSGKSIKEHLDKQYHLISMLKIYFDEVKYKKHLERRAETCITYDIDRTEINRYLRKRQIEDVLENNDNEK